MRDAYFFAAGMSVCSSFDAVGLVASQSKALVLFYVVAAVFFLVVGFSTNKQNSPPR